MSDTALVVLTALCLILGVGCWAAFTIPFIRSFEQRANLNYVTLIVMPIIHIFWAFALGITNKREIPIGVFLHIGFLIIGITSAVLYFARS